MADTPKDSPPGDPALGRFWLLQMSRLLGLGLVVVAVLIAARKIEAPELAGYALLLIGAATYFALPKWLARRWKSPPQ